MFKLHVYSQSGDLDLHAVIEGDSATIGRSADCNIVIDRKDISRRHARLLRGWVVDDLGSRNGTHVEGVKIEEASPIASRCFEVGDPTSQNLVTIEVESSDRPADAPVQAAEPKPAGAPVPAAGPAADPESVPTGSFRAEVELLAEQYRSKCSRLENELNELQRKLEGFMSAAGPRDELAQQREENRQLLARIEKLEHDAENRKT
ncbi:MAG: FHA domain-containing protein [Planctomycetota bacterium]